MLIDPRQEDPLEYLQLDLIDTFFFTPRPGISAADIDRANYTLGVLRLNTRPLLPHAREQSYKNYRLRLGDYVRERQAGASEEVLQKSRNALLSMGHVSVWREMVRQRYAIAEVDQLFRDAPEAAQWR
jgi:hypothetical protein